MLNYSNAITEEKSYSGLQMKEVKPIMKLILRGKKREFLSAVGKSLNLILPAETNTFTKSDKLTALWLSPDEWMIFSNEVSHIDSNDYQTENLLNKNISIVITDSMTRPFRYGVINFALSSSKIQSLIDLKGSNDIYGNKIKGTEVALADELAAAAGLLMGQSNEKKPVVIIKGYQGINEIDKDAVNLIVKDDDDLYR